MSAGAANDERAGFTPPELLRLLGDETRLRALMLMQAEGELCVCELTAAMAVSQPKMSRHLALLRDAGLVHDRRERVWIHYRIAPELADWMGTVLAALQAGTRDEQPYRADRERLAAIPDRPGLRCDE